MPPLLPPLLHPHPMATQWLQAPNLSLSILRLDEIHPLVSGNKWLKLCGWLEAGEKDTPITGLLTLGGPWSNHVHATAAYCHRMGWRFQAIIKSHSQAITPMLQDVLNWGGSITWAQKTNFYNSLHWQQQAKEQHLHYIPMGGDGAAGILGVTQYFNLLATSFRFDEIWCAVGTGTTLQGIAQSQLQAPLLVGFNPGIKDALLAQKIANIQSPVPRSIRLDMAPPNSFGKITPNLIESMNEWWLQTGIPTDVVYTGKMLQFFQQSLAVESKITKSVLLVHTGGLQGNRSVQNGLLKFTGES